MASAAQGKELTSRLTPKVRASDSSSTVIGKEESLRFEILGLDFFYGSKHAVFGLNL